MLPNVHSSQPLSCPLPEKRYETTRRPSNVKPPPPPPRGPCGWTGCTRGHRTPSATRTSGTHGSKRPGLLLVTFRNLSIFPWKVRTMVLKKCRFVELRSFKRRGWGAFLRSGCCREIRQERQICLGRASLARKGLNDRSSNFREASLLPILHVGSFENLLRSCWSLCPARGVSRRPLFCRRCLPSGALLSLLSCYEPPRPRLFIACVLSGPSGTLLGLPPPWSDRPLQSPCPDQGVLGSGHVCPSVQRPCSSDSAVLPRPRTFSPREAVGLLRVGAPALGASLHRGSKVRASWKEGPMSGQLSAPSSAGLLGCHRLTARALCIS